MRLVHVSRKSYPNIPEGMHAIGVYSQDRKELKDLEKSIRLRPFKNNLVTARKHDSLGAFGFASIWIFKKCDGQMKLFKLAYHLAHGRVVLSNKDDAQLAASEYASKIESTAERVLKKRTLALKKAKRVKAETRKRRREDGREEREERRRLKKRADIIKYLLLKQAACAFDRCLSRAREYDRIKMLE